MNVDCSVFFERNIVPIWKTSLRTGEHKKEKALIQSERNVINFEKVKTEYLKKHNLKNMCGSADAMLVGDDCTYLIEFKSGFISKQEVYGVKKQFYDSVIMYMDLADAKVSEVRDKLILVLVYSGKKNEDNELVKHGRENQMPESENYRFLAKRIAGYAKQDYVEFGLECFKGFCCREVKTYTEKEFEEIVERL